MLPNFAIQAYRIDFVHRIYFWFSFYCACASFKQINVSIHLVRNRKMRRFTIFKTKICSPPPLDPANPLYCRRVLSIYTIYMYVSGKVGGTIFSKSQKMSGQTPVWKKYTQMTFKMGSWSPNHSQIFASCHLPCM